MPQKVSLTLRPDTKFDVPSSEGYQLYSAILDIMRESNEGISRHTHDSPISSISISTLDGTFGKSIRQNHKTLEPGERYRLDIGITDPKEIEIFQSIIGPLILKERNLRLDKGTLRVEEVTSTTASFEDLLQASNGMQDPCIDFTFKSTTCIPYKNSKVYEMFPHREAVFSSLAAKWNAVCPEGLKMSLERDEIARHVMERPLSYETHSVMVNTVIDRAKGHPRPILRQGFTGHCLYTFARGAPLDTRNVILVLSKFAEFSGVGSAVSRGCGAVKVAMGEMER